MNPFQPANGGGLSDLFVARVADPTPPANLEGNINRSDPNVPDSGDQVVDLKDLQWFDNFINGTFIPAAGGSPQPLTAGPSATENARRDVAPFATGGDGCMNSLDRQQMTLMALHLATPGATAGPTVLNQCPPPSRPAGSQSGPDQGRSRASDNSIKRSLGLTLTDGPTGFAMGVDMNAVGDETQAMFTLEFDPSELTIDGTSFPDANPDITLGTGAPEGTTMAVNAASAATGRVTVMLNFNGQALTGRNRRLETSISTSCRAIPQEQPP